MNLHVELVLLVVLEYNMDNKCLYEFGCNKKDCNEDFCERQFRLSVLYKNSLIPEAQQKHITLDIEESNKIDLAAFQQLAGIARDIDSFIKNGHNLFIYSHTCGNGKTSWAIKLLEAYFYKVWAKVDLSCHALFVNVPRFLLALKANISTPNEYAQAILDNATKADVVVWDDLAFKIGTEFELNHLLSIIDARISAGKCNIYTSNVAPNELTISMGDRLASRVANLSLPIHFLGKDMRSIDIKV